MVDCVHLLPSSKLCCVYPSRSKARVGWYEDLRFRYETVDFDDPVALAEATRRAQEKATKITDLLVLPRSQITRQHVELYRFKEPLVEYPEQPVPLDPYLLGLWLGDGTSRTPAITTVDRPVRDYLYEYARKNGLTVSCVDKRNREESNVNDGELEYTAAYRLCNTHGHNSVLDALRSMNLLWDGEERKHIPESYIHNHRDVRMKLLAGILDTDGNLSTRTAYDIHQKGAVLSNDIVRLARSLGYHTTVVDCVKYATNTVDQHRHTYKRVRISMNQLSDPIPVLLDRKRFHPEAVVQWDNPLIDEYGAPQTRIKTSWTEEADAALLAEVERQKQTRARVDWKGMTEAPLNQYGSDSKRTRYRDLTMSEEEKLEKREKRSKRNASASVPVAETEVRPTP